MKKECLDICDKPLIESECWSYYKFAMMQTLDEIPLWLTNHFSVFVTNDGTALFGENGKVYPLTYYSDLLDIIDGEILSVHSRSIVDYLKQKIHQGYYVVLDVNYNKLKNDNGFWLHETLIYGYTSTGFYTTILKNGSFVSQCISYDIIESAYDDAWEYYKADVNRVFYRRAWFYGITLVKLKKGFRNDNAQYDALNKLRAEMDGGMYIIDKYGNDGTNAPKYFTGSACLKHIIDLLSSLDNNDENIFHKMRNYKNACVKIVENQKILCEIMRWCIRDNNGEEICEMVEAYEKSINNVMVAAMLFNKFEQTTNRDIIVRIIDRLNDTTVIQKDLIGNFIPMVTSIYKNNYLLRNNA